MLKKPVLEKLNEQIGHEFFSSNLYLQMSAWCADQGLDGCAAFLRVHSQEEMGHMFRLFDYVIESDEKPLLPALEQPQADYESVQNLFEEILEHEKMISAKIAELVEVAFSEKDFFTFNFLQWYVSEQHEEEALARSNLDKLRLVGTEGRGIFFFDAELGRMRAGEKIVPSDAGGAGEGE
jgi:ferritin